MRLRETQNDLQLPVFFFFLHINITKCCFSGIAFLVSAIDPDLLLLKKDFLWNLFK